MARAGKKTLWEDDVRQLLGMPVPVDAALAADTSLEKAFSMSKPKPSHQMAPRKTDSKGYETLEDSGFRFSGKLVLTTMLVLLACGGVIIIVDEAGQASRSDIRKQGINVAHPRRGRSKGIGEHAALDALGMPKPRNLEDEVVGKNNWKDLQRKADEERRKERAIHLQSAGGLRGRQAKDDGDDDDSTDVEKSGERVGGDHDQIHHGGARHSGGKTGPPGGWAQKNGGPHSGVAKDFGAGIFDW